MSSNSPKQFQKHLAAKKATSTLAERVDAKIQAITSPAWRDTTDTVRPPSPERDRHSHRVHLFSLKCQVKQLLRSIQDAEAAIGRDEP
jgi:hypothetical protein